MLLFIWNLRLYTVVFPALTVAYYCYPDFAVAYCALLEFHDLTWTFCCLPDCILLFNRILLVHTVDCLDCTTAHCSLPECYDCILLFTRILLKHIAVYLDIKVAYVLFTWILLHFIVHPDLKVAYCFCPESSCCVCHVTCIRFMYICPSKGCNYSELK